ncbi:SDR family NAD(P)-dependent oxidoreductase, partial [Actinomycetospora sp. OC33-EN08]
GGLTVEQGARVVARRATVIREHLAGHGAMASVPLPAAELELPDGLSIAAINGPASTVVSGDVDAVEAFIAHSPVEVKRIAVDYASHSAHVDAVMDMIVSELDGLTPAAGTTPLFSTVRGELLDTEQMDAGYWAENLRRPVQLQQAIEALAAESHDIFVEVSPHPVLTGAVGDTAPDALVVGTLRRDHGTRQQALLALGALHVRGITPDWDAVIGEATPVKNLPTYAFEHRRFWPRPAPGAGDVTAAGMTDTAHSLVAAAVGLAGRDAVVLSGRISTAGAQAWLADHVVGGRVFVPGTALLELAVRAGDEIGATAVEELTLHAPLVLDGAVVVQVDVEPDGDGRAHVGVHSRPEHDPDAWTRHADGVLGTTPVEPPTPVTGPWPPAAEVVDADALYDGLALAGLEYGPTFRGLDAVWRDGDTLHAEVTLPDGAEAAGWAGVHPALLDAALHALAAGADGDDPRPRLPFSWSGVRVHATGATALRVTLRPTGDDGVSVHATDPSGAPVLSVDSLVLRAAATPTATPGTGALYRLAWPVLETDGDAASALARYGDDADGRLGAHPVVDDLGSATTDVLVAVGRGGAHRDPEATHATLHDALALVQHWLDREDDGRRLVVVTRGAVGPDTGHAPDEPAAAVWGLVRSAQTEAPDRLVLVDTDGSDASLAALPAALASGEPQLALRDGAVHRLRLSADAPADTLTPPDVAAWRLESTDPGTIDALDLLAAPDLDRPLAADEVRVAVRAAGVNFRDVMLALGLYPGQVAMGGEAAGVVVEVGADVDDLAVGDQVTGIVGGSFGPTSIADHRLLVPMPTDWSFAEAAAAPVAWTTAYHALVDLGGLAAGQTVLVHAATGGVGTAAVHLARSLGARVLATASPAKWPVLRGMGFAEDEITSSRDASFEAMVHAATAGEGVDVVLDSLAGDLVDAGLRCLRPGGVFLEMGKTDVRDPATVAGVTYRAFDVNDAGTARLGEILRTVGDVMAAQGALPVTAWDVREAREAFRFVSQARHVGKVVLTIPQAVPDDGAVLVAGGTGTLGALAARRLVERHGVSDVVLLSRSGRVDDALLDDLRAAGAAVEVVACDVTDRAAVAGLVADLGRPVVGIVAATGTLDDGVVGSLTPERVDAVVAAKLDAVAALEAATVDADLAFFVAYSGYAGISGGPGQASYAAANVALDAWARGRARRGLPGRSLAWGLWDVDGGMTGHLTDADRTRMARGGVVGLSADAGMALFDAALELPDVVLVPAALDRGALAAHARAGTLPPLLADLTSVRAPARRRAAAGTDSTDDLAARLARTPADERHGVVLEVVRAHVAAVLGHDDPRRLEAGAAFSDLGFDSLTAVELRNRLGAATGLRLPATAVFDHPTPSALAGEVLARIDPGDAPEPAEEPSSLDGRIAGLEAALAALTSDDVVGIAPDEAARDAVTLRLRALVEAWTESRPDAATARVAEQLSDASDDDLFDFIDQKLGD